MDSSKISLAYAMALVTLWEDARAVSKAVYYWRVELPQHNAQRFFKLIVDNHVLVDSKKAMRQVLEGLDGKVD